MARAKQTTSSTPVDTMDGQEDTAVRNTAKTSTKLSENAIDDPVRMYLKQMGQVPLLTREQEVEISKRIEDAEIEVQKFLHRFGFVAFVFLVQTCHFIGLMGFGDTVVP